jgi:hypothetical protein
MISTFRQRRQPKCVLLQQTMSTGELMQGAVKTLEVGGSPLSEEAGRKRPKPALSSHCGRRLHIFLAGI